jgi:hypothetical protein
MASPAGSKRKLPLIPLVSGAVVVLCLIAAAIYFSRPTKPAPGGPATGEAKAYLPYLALSGVSMQASENFMKQQVVEVQGAIANNGPRALRSIEVYCIFYNVSGQAIHRERLPIVSTQQQPLAPGSKRNFRLPFDALPDGWNQSMPNLVIAQIQFVR